MGVMSLFLPGKMSVREGFKKTIKKGVDEFLHLAGWLGSAGGQNPSKKIINETASNNLKSDLNQTNIFTQNG